MTNTKIDKEDQKEKKIRVARERFKLAEEAESEIRQVALADLEFRAGEQWPEDMKNNRKLENRPCLTINRMPQFVRQITNDQRQNRSSIKVSPVDDQADVETAKIFQGLIKHIENHSNADIAYETAFDGAVTKGFGFFRVITKYADPLSFEQEILIKRIRNSFSVYLDPASKEPDGSDANWGFVFEDIPREDFDAEYGETELSKSEDWRSVGDQAPGWISESTVRVAEYFYKEFKTVDVVQLSNGQSIEKTKLPAELPEGITIDRERKSVVPVIHWCKLNGIEILSETIWPGKWIPIIPVVGDELDVNGKIIREGVIRHAKDSQQMYNYMASTEAEVIALSPKAPYIVAEGQIPKEYEHQWKTANIKTHAYLTYKPTTHNGSLAGAPQRNTYEAPVQAITSARMQASEDIKATTGIYDSAMGARSNETSGVAIRGRQQQAQTSNFHFTDNLNRAKQHCGRILVDLIPHIYDTPRTARIIGEEGQEEIIKLNEIFKYKGEERSFDLGIGKYDVVMETGPAFATKRQEAAAAMMDMTKMNPKVLDIVGDLMFKNMDWPGHNEMSERWKKQMPPGLIDDPNKQKPLPPEVQAQMQQMDQMIQMQTQQLQSMSEEMKNKKLELESRERIETMKAEVTMKTKLLEISSKEAMIPYLRQMDEIDRRQQLLNMDQPIGGFEDSQMQPPQQQPQPNFNDPSLDQGMDQQQTNPPGGPSPEQFIEE